MKIIGSGFFRMASTRRPFGVMLHSIGCSTLPERSCILNSPTKKSSNVETVNHHLGLIIIIIIIMIITMIMIMTMIKLIIMIIILIIKIK